MEKIVTEELNKGSLNQENNMTSEELNKLAKQAISDIERCKGRLEEVQSACQHKKTKVEPINNTLKKTCEVCYSIVGYPTVDEIRAAGYVI